MTTSEEQARRPMSTALVRVGERALDVPGSAALGLWRESQRVVIGAIAFAADLRQYRTVAREVAELEEAKRRANFGVGKHPTPEQWRKVEQDRAKRTRIIAAAAAGALVALLALSVSQYRWHPWFYLAVGAPVVLLIAGRYYRARWVTALAPISTPALLPWGIEDLRWWPSIAVAVLAAVACEYRGGLVSPPGSPGPGTDKARPGVALPKLWETVRLRLLEEKITAAHHHTRLLVVDSVEVGAAFGLTTREAMTDKAVEAVAREVHVGRRWVRYVHPSDEPVGEMLVYWANPLAGTPPPPTRRFGELRYRSSFSVGRDDNGHSEALCLAYTHFLLFGYSGSGKSSVVRVIVDAAEEMPDVDLYGIDTAGGSTLGAQRRRLGDKRVATGPLEVEQAEAILDGLIAEAARRSNSLADQEDYDEDGVVDERFITDDVNGRRGIVLVVGEYDDFCRYGRLVSRLLALGAVARKCAISIVVESPTLAKDRLGEGREFIAISMVKVAMACSNSDVVQGLGATCLDQGWRPDLLQPESEGRRNDAGIGYIYGGGRNRPKLTGFHPLTPDDAADRRRMRRRDRDQWYRHIAPASDPHDTVVDAVEVPAVLIAIQDAMGDGDTVTSAAAARVAGMDPSSLAAAVRPYGLTPSKWREGATTPRGYTREALVKALDGLS